MRFTIPLLPCPFFLFFRFFFLSWSARVMVVEVKHTPLHCFLSPLYRFFVLLFFTFHVLLTRAGSTLGAVQNMRSRGTSPFSLVIIHQHINRRTTEQIITANRAVDASQKESRLAAAQHPLFSDFRGKTTVHPAPHSLPDLAKTPQARISRGLHSSRDRHSRS